MAQRHEFADFVTELLAPLGGVSARRMFGGHGLYRDAVMFALIADDTLYFKTDAINRSVFEAAGSQAFRYARQGRLVALSYHQAPDAAFDSATAMQPWAESGFAAALRGRKVSRRSAAPAAAKN